MKDINDLTAQMKVRTQKNKKKNNEILRNTILHPKKIVKGKS